MHEAGDPRYIFCPVMSDSDMNHSGGKLVMLEGFATNGGYLSVWACADDPWSIQTSCEPDEVIAIEDEIDLTYATTSGTNGWAAGSTWYPYLVFLVPEHAHLTGYRVDAP